MVFAPALWSSVAGWLLFLVIAISLAFLLLFSFSLPIPALKTPLLLLLFLSPVFAILAVLGLYILGKIIGNRIIIDKLTESIVFEKRPFLLINRRRLIPLSSVRSVVIDYEPDALEIRMLNEWKVYLDVGEKLKLGVATNKANMLHLSSEISKFIERPLVDNSAKPVFTSLFRSFYSITEERILIRETPVGRNLLFDAQGQTLVSKWKVFGLTVSKQEIPFSQIRHIQMETRSVTSTEGNHHRVVSFSLYITLWSGKHIETNLTRLVFPVKKEMMFSKISKEEERATVVEEEHAIVVVDAVKKMLRLPQLDLAARIRTFKDEIAIETSNSKRRKQLAKDYLLELKGTSANEPSVRLALYESLADAFKQLKSRELVPLEETNREKSVALFVDRDGIGFAVSSEDLDNEGVDKLVGRGFIYSKDESIYQKYFQGISTREMPEMIEWTFREVFQCDQSYTVTL